MWFRWGHVHSWVSNLVWHTGNVRRKGTGRRTGRLRKDCMSVLDSSETDGPIPTHYLVSYDCQHIFRCTATFQCWTTVRPASCHTQRSEEDGKMPTRLGVFLDLSHCATKNRQTLVFDTLIRLDCVGRCCFLSLLLLLLVVVVLVVSSLTLSSSSSQFVHSLEWYDWILMQSPCLERLTRVPIRTPTTIHHSNHLGTFQLDRTCSTKAKAMTTRSTSVCFVWLRPCFGATRCTCSRSHSRLQCWNETLVRVFRISSCQSSRICLMLPYPVQNRALFDEKTDEYSLPVVSSSLSLSSHVVLGAESVSSFGFVVFCLKNLWLDRRFHILNGSEFLPVCPSTPQDRKNGTVSF